MAPKLPMPVRRKNQDWRHSFTSLNAYAVPPLHVALLFPRFITGQESKTPIFEQEQKGFPMKSNVTESQQKIRHFLLAMLQVWGFFYFKKTLTKQNVSVGD